MGNNECWLCGRYGVTHMHHLLSGTANRKLSEKYGLVVNVCPDCHRRIHEDPELNRYTKEFAQKRWKQEQNGTDEDFIRVFGKSYL
jgi:hypothetical protein